MDDERDVTASLFGPLQPVISYSYGNRTDWFVMDGGSHIYACPRAPVRKLMAYDEDGNLDPDHPDNVFPAKYVEALEHNQDIGMAPCCRHPEHHDVIAWYSCPAQRDLGWPDIFIFICTAFHADEVLEEVDEKGNPRLDEDGNAIWLKNPRPNSERWHRRICGGPDERPSWGADRCR